MVIQGYNQPATRDQIYEAMNYLLRRYDELTSYLGIADMPLDNTDTERSIRDMLMGMNPERWLTYVLKPTNTIRKKIYTSFQKSGKMQKTITININNQ